MTAMSYSGSNDDRAPRLTIGVPRALDYFLHYPLVRELLTGLGFEVRLSALTNRAVLDAGTTYTVTDACIPIKVFHGHVHALLSVCDAIYLPRLVKVRRVKHEGRSFRESFCPKFIGLPDIVRNTMGLETVEQLGPGARARRLIRRRLRLAQLPPPDGVRELPIVRRGQPDASLPVGSPVLIDINVDLTRRLATLYRVANQLRRFRYFSYLRLYGAYRRALRSQRRYEALLGLGLPPDEALRALDSRARAGASAAGERGVLALVGYPYLLFDPYLGAGVVKRFVERGYDVWTPWRLWKDRRSLVLGARHKARPFFWYFSNIVADAALYLVHYGLTAGQLRGEPLTRRGLLRHMVSSARGRRMGAPTVGLVHMTSATCGPDAFVGKTLELEAKRAGCSLLILQVDEQSGEAGLITRIEAFCDMLERKPGGGRVSR
jgi:predicted nucleotide-binding protein (sugar kinase/HSP70/actin superfamily)